MPRRRIALDEFLERGTKLTSPRSLEACLRCGIEPEELLPQDLESFIPKGLERDDLEREAAQIRYNHFENLRQKKVKMTLAEYNNICKEYAMRSPGTGREAKDVEEEYAKLKEEAVDSTMVEMEERRLERIKQRQEKEIQSLLLLLVCFLYLFVAHYCLLQNLEMLHLRRVSICLACC